jgi:lipid-binding SYLF domain-containing protein
MHIRSSLLMLFAGAVLAGACPGAHAQAREQGRLLIASQVLEELRGTRDEAIPDRLLERAYGIAVIPDLTKVAFFAGGRRGHGVLVVRDKQGRFSNPVFITMTGGSFGWQWGVQSTDIVLVFTTPKGVEGINGGKVTLGADASVAAGPVGRQAEAGTDASFKSEVYSYSRSRGVFAGLALDGTAITIDDGANAAFYRKPAVAAGPVGRQAEAGTDASFKSEVYSYSRSRGVFAGLALDGTAITIDDGANAAFYRKPAVAAGDIISGAVTSEEESARRFLAAVASSTRTHSDTQRSASAADPVTPPPAKPAASGTQSYPLADPHPGQEPK